MELGLGCFRLRQCCCHPALMLTGAQGVDVDEGLEESLQSLSLDHMPQARSHDSHMWLVLAYPFASRRNQVAFLPYLERIN